VIKTKIVATIGPASGTADMLRQLQAAGMSVARLNGSHATLDWHRDAIRLIREAVPGVPILLDIPGRKVRTTRLAHEPQFGIGDRVTLTTDTAHDGTQKVPVSYGDLHRDLHAGDVIFADDGTLRFTVEAIVERDIVCRAEVAGTLRSRKGINVPMVRLQMALITDRDREMVAFAREHGVDFIGISFVESAQHVEAVRALVGGASPQILAKVENRGGLENLAAVVGAADAIMIDRGDLSVETTVEQVAVHQKTIIEAARAAGKPVVVATEMLHTMIDNDFPTKAEVSDITNAVLDGCSATMLSGETAVGRHPVAAIQTMRRVADAASAHLLAKRRPTGSMTVPEATAAAIAMMLGALPITKVVAITRSGYAARILSSLSVAQPILAVSDDPQMARAFNLLAGVEGVCFETPFPRGSADHVKACLKQLLDSGKLASADHVLVTGVIYPRSGTRMNLLQVHQMSELIETFGW
jgi:pyruvate kinase